MCKEVAIRLRLHTSVGRGNTVSEKVSLHQNADFLWLCVNIYVRFMGYRR